jgi:hypothetical protein
MKNPESIVLVETGEVREDVEKTNLPRPPAVVSGPSKWGTGPFDEVILLWTLCAMFTTSSFTVVTSLYGPPWMSYIGRWVRSSSTAVPSSSLLDDCNQHAFAQ